ncbi:hypothetical protein GPUN_1340 [Glaciecola punicea ACAM 611]|jgi:membrane protein DedA with SNARE-associated domain|uniref:VTT domain-containing protein n=1 Tax=Glaciecola punicea ACAM 611 TaxID=1121923 RepID=H5TAY7_9ALTE|nr:DedA family protein [Glaciecola punicea]OFA32483.1 hypothetical protein BAE46_05580 [Glaciecola punicea]GAB55464.1 hypothetical protein GPUN_1340 [Glaciecola punicea ACAM 611]
METILQIISDYGVLSYAILFLYCALKSGALPLFAGIAAHLGALDIVIVGAAVIMGGYLGDELRFYLGRKYGVQNLWANKHYQKSVHTARLLLNRYGKAYIFLYRYPKGMRTIGALPVALTDMPWQVFTGLNFASALTWAFALVGTGYLFGAALDYYVGDNWGVFSVALLGIFFLLTYIAYRHINVVAREELDKEKRSLDKP